ncbi:MAG TPA: transporter substrate-binding domain-containing protein [Gammaproteobacteria bacterium]|nr:transporter substrate-binding domain-containing protein [Gammaproteobacteria bacterium]
MIKKIIASLLCVFSCNVMAAPLTIRFVMEATYPPFEYMDANGQIQGFDVDLAKAICASIKAECTFSNQAFNGLIPSIQIGKFDAIISALSVTDERKQQVNFTNSYYEPSAAFVAPLKAKESLNAINGKVIGVQQGSTHESYLKDKYADKVTIKNYASIQDAFLDLLSGRVDMVLADTPIANDWLKKANHADQFGVVGKPIIDHAYFGSGYAIAVNKNNTDLLEMLNQGLAAVKKDGTLNQLYQTYFGHVANQ